jgi:hypothetical protein
MEEKIRELKQQRATLDMQFLSTRDLREKIKLKWQLYDLNNEIKQLETERRLACI